MTYETKCLIIALSKIVKRADSLEEVYDTLREMAEAEGITLTPYTDARQSA